MGFSHSAALVSPNYGDMHLSRLGSHVILLKNSIRSASKSAGQSALNLFTRSQEKKLANAIALINKLGHSSEQTLKFFSDYKHFTQDIRNNATIYSELRACMDYINRPGYGSVRELEVFVKRYESMLTRMLAGRQADAAAYTADIGAHDLKQFIALVKKVIELRKRYALGYLGFEAMQERKDKLLKPLKNYLQILTKSNQRRHEKRKMLKQEYRAILNDYVLSLDTLMASLSQETRNKLLAEYDELAIDDLAKDSIRLSRHSIHAAMQVDEGIACALPCQHTDGCHHCPSRKDLHAYMYEHDAKSMAALQEDIMRLERFSYYAIGTETKTLQHNLHYAKSLLSKVQATLISEAAPA